MYLVCSTWIFSWRTVRYHSVCPENTAIWYIKVSLFGFNRTEFAGDNSLKHSFCMTIIFQYILFFFYCTEEILFSLWKDKDGKSVNYFYEGRRAKEIIIAGFYEMRWQHNKIDFFHFYSKYFFLSDSESLIFKVLLLPYIYARCQIKEKRLARINDLWYLFVFQKKLIQNIFSQDS